MCTNNTNNDKKLPPIPQKYGWMTEANKNETLRQIKLFFHSQVSV